MLNYMVKVLSFKVSKLFHAFKDNDFYVKDWQMMFLRVKWYAVRFDTLYIRFLNLLVFINSFFFIFESIQVWSRYGGSWVDAWGKESEM